MGSASGFNDYEPTTHLSGDISPDNPLSLYCLASSVFLVSSVLYPSSFFPLFLMIDETPSPSTMSATMLPRRFCRRYFCWKVPLRFWLSRTYSAAAALSTASASFFAKAAAFSALFAAVLMAFCSLSAAFAA
jgi:hypothetical protein